MKTKNTNLCLLNSLGYKLALVFAIMFASQISAQQKFTIYQNDGTNQHFLVNGLKLTFDNNGSFSCWRDGSKKDITFTSVGIIYFTKVLTLIADAGTDQSVNEGATVSLDASASSDPDGNPLTYKWTAPAGITLSSNSIGNPTFTAPKVKNDSILTFLLVVNDGTVDSPPSTVNITVLNVIKVGVSSLDSQLFKVYPNPTTGIVTVEITGVMGRTTEVLVMSLVGAEIYRKEIAGATKFQIDLSDQVSGVYLLKISSNNRQNISKIVIRKE